MTTHNNTPPNSTTSDTNSSLHSHLDGYAQQAKGKTGITRIINASTYSRDGLLAAYQNEAAFRQVAWLNGVLLLVLVVMPFSIVIKMLLVFASFFSLVVELFNTGLEASIDHTSTERHPLAKIGKDVGSAAQLLALTLLFMLWMMALYATFM
ncbi:MULTISPECIES: diacylglycerol kinase [unclassified Moraxella]|uniref:diacylglycerol kinase n=1 Tax=unclassified Moraxella TaxID=2685852 RepID=UPI003AF75951